MTGLAFAAPLIGVLLMQGLQRAETWLVAVSLGPALPHGGWPVATSVPASPSRRFIRITSSYSQVGSGAAEVGHSAAALG